MSAPTPAHGGHHTPKKASNTPQQGGGGLVIIRAGLLVLAFVCFVIWGRHKWNEEDTKKAAVVISHQQLETRTISFGADWGEVEIFSMNSVINWGGSTRPFRVKNRAGLEVRSNELEKLADQINRADPGANQALQLKSEDGESGKVVVTVTVQ